MSVTAKEYNSLPVQEKIKLINERLDTESNMNTRNYLYGYLHGLQERLK